MVVFHSYVSLPEGISNISSKSDHFCKTHIFSEQATVGVRKLQHFLCKDPTAYGATGQN